MLRLQQTASSGRRGYSIMSRAKQQAGIAANRGDSVKGIPRDLIKPKSTTRLPTRESYPSRENAADRSNRTNAPTRPERYDNARHSAMRSRGDTFERSGRWSERSNNDGRDPPMRPRENPTGRDGWHTERFNHDSPRRPREDTFERREGGWGSERGHGRDPAMGSREDRHGQNGWRSDRFDSPRRSREDFERNDRRSEPYTGHSSRLSNTQSESVRPTSKLSLFLRPTNLGDASNRWVKRGLVNSFEANQTEPSTSNVIPLGAPRTSQLFQQPRHPAGLAERMAKVYREFPQPPNPRLLRVAVIGAANAGKSTLMNGVIAEEVSVVSHKAHTTRERVLGVLTDENHQLVFLDTPGVVPDNRHAKMDRTLVTSSWRSLDEADHVILVVDGAWALKSEEHKADDLILSRLSELGLPTTLVINKMDLIDEEERGDELKKMVDVYQERCPVIANVIHISALHGDGLEAVKSDLFMRAKPAKWMYPKEIKNDMPDLKRAEELIRVEFFKRLHQYIPYMLKQENVGWTELPNGALRIDQNVYVERESQLKIVVGANGSVVDRVVEEARKQIATSLKRPVQLFIQVKARKR